MLKPVSVGTQPENVPSLIITPSSNPTGEIQEIKSGRKKLTLMASRLPTWRLFMCRLSKSLASMSQQGEPLVLPEPIRRKEALTKKLTRRVTFRSKRVNRKTMREQPFCRMDKPMHDTNSKTNTFTNSLFRSYDSHAQLLASQSSNPADLFGQMLPYCCRTFPGPLGAASACSASEILV
jgi:hypothetical protein